jgi:hypothetical protein
LAIADSENGPEARAQALKQIGAWLKRFKDPIGREVRIESVAGRMKITRELLLRAMGETPVASPVGGRAPQTSQAARPMVRPAMPPYSGNPQRSNPRSTQNPARTHASEKVLLQALVRGGEGREILNETGAKLPPGWGILELIENSALREAAQEILNAWESRGDLRGYQPELENPDLRSLITATLVESEPEYSSAQLRFAADRGVARAWARFSQRIKTELAAAEAKQDAELQAKLMKDYLDVQRKMKEFTNFYDEA